MVCAEGKAQALQGSQVFCGSRSSRFPHKSEVVCDRRPVLLFPRCEQRRGTATFQNKGEQTVRFCLSLGNVARKSRNAAFWR